MRLNNGSTSGSLDYGPGGNSARPQASRWFKIYNGTGADMFVPDNSTAEKNNTYNYVGNIPGVSQWKGMAGDATYTYTYTADLGTGPCWYPNFGGSWVAPAACPSGWTEVSNFQGFTNPNFASGVGTVSNTSAAWVFYQVYGWGCGAPYQLAAWVRVCRK